MAKTKLGAIGAIFDNIEPDKRVVVDELIKNAEYTAGLLIQLQKEIRNNGVIGHTAAGNITESPLVKSYNSLLKSYSTIIGQLIRYLPDGRANDDIAPLKQFIALN